MSPGFWNYNIQSGYSFDTKGNIALQWTYVGGVTSGTPAASVGAFQMITNASSVEGLNGPGYQIGGSKSALIPETPVNACAGAELNIIKKSNNEGHYFGLTSFQGVSFGAPGGELHTEWGETHTIFKINVYSVLDGIYESIMTW